MVTTKLKGLNRLMQIVPVHTMKVHSGSRIIAPLILNLGTRSSTVRSIYNRVSTPLTIN
jgi:hypothetical protein